ncbi:MAG: MBL fold metallo-hydrolase [Tepidisphaeraceae bacterium]
MRNRSGDGRCSVEEVVGGAPTPQRLEALLGEIGLPRVPIYGGETTCIQVETSEGSNIILDAGSGIRRCSFDIAHRWQNRADREIHLFGSHEHLDHRSGLAFSRFCYADDPPYTVRIHGSYGFLRAIDSHYGVFSRQTGECTHVDDPIDFTYMKAKFIGTEFRRDGDEETRKERHWAVRGLSPVQVGRTVVRPFEVYHGIPCLGYRLEHDGKVFVFATDHELRRGGDRADPRQIRSMEAEARVVEMSRGADLAYYDAQYFLEEYLGHKALGAFPAKSRMDWGHTCIEDAVERTIAAGVKHALLGHHDPDRDWAARVEMDAHLAELCQGRPYRIQLAEGDAVFDL